MATTKYLSLFAVNARVVAILKKNTLGCHLYEYYPKRSLENLFNKMDHYEESFTALHSDVGYYELDSDMCSSCQIRYRAAFLLECAKRYQKLDTIGDEVSAYIFVHCNNLDAISPQALFGVEHTISVPALEEMFKFFSTKFTDVKKDFLRIASQGVDMIKSNSVNIAVGATAMTISAMLMYKISNGVISILTKLVQTLFSFMLPEAVFNFIFDTSEHEKFYVDKIVSQSGESDIAKDSPLWRLVIKLFMCACVGCTPLISSSVISSSIWGKALDVFKTRGVVEALKEIMDYICSLFGLPYSFSRSIPNVVENNIVELINIYNYLKRRDIFHHPLSENDFVAAARSCDKYTDYVKKFTTNKPVSDYLHNYRSHFEVVSAAVVNYKKTVIRMEPVAVSLYGKPGVGKTCSLNTIIGALAGEIYGDKYDSNLLTYTRNPAQDFWDGYDCQPFVLYDDFLQLKDSEAKPNPEINDIIRCVNTNGFNLNMADLASKGVTYFVSEWIFATSNVKNLQGVKSIHSTSAIDRRLQLNFEMTLSISFPTPEGDVNCVDYLSRKHLEFTAANPLSTSDQIDDFMMNTRNKLWSFTTFVWSPTDHVGFQPQVLNFEELLHMCRDLYLKKKRLATTHKPHIPKGFIRKRDPVIAQSGIFKAAQNIKLGVSDLYNSDSFSNKCKFFPHTDMTFLHEVLLDTLPALFIENEGLTDAVLYDVYLSAVMRNAVFIDGRISVDMHTATDLELSGVQLPDPYHPGDKVSIGLWHVVEGNMQNVYYREFLRRLAISLKRFQGESINVSDFYCVLAEVTSRHVWDKLKSTHSNYGPIVGFLKVSIAAMAICAGLKALKKVFGYTKDKTISLVNKIITQKQAASNVSDYYVNSSVVPQGAVFSGQNIINYMMSKMKKNMLRFRIQFEGKEEEQELGYAIVPKTGVLIFPAHFIRHFLKYYAENNTARVVFYTLTIDTTAEEKIYPYYISAIEMMKMKPFVRIINGVEHATDLVIHNCTTLEHRDMTDTFLNYTDVVDGKVPLLENSAGAHIMVKPDMSQPLLRLSSVGKVGRYFGNLTNYTDGAIPTKMLHNYMTYNLSTFAGDCGGLVMFTTPVGYKMGGVHCAADQRGTAFCGMIFRDDFEKLTQSTFTVSRDLVEQAYVVKTNAVPPYFKSSLEAYPAEMTPPYKETMSFKPSRMSVFITESGEKISPMKRATKRYTGLHATYDKNFDNGFVSDVTVHISGFASDHSTYDRVWSFEEAVLGVPGISYLDACNRSTSSGYKYSSISPNGKIGFFGDAVEYDLSRAQAKLLCKDVNDIIEDAKVGVRHEHVFRDCLKDELLKPSKIASGDTRLFSTGPLDLQLATKMYFGAFCKMLHDNRIPIGISIGINPHTEWKHLYHHLTKRFSNAFAGDFSGYDYTTTPCIFEMCLEVINTWYRVHDATYHASHDDVRRVLHAEVYNSLHIGMDGTYYWLGNNSSGHACTADNNSMFNLLLFAYCARELTNRSLFDIADFCIYGDDNIFVTNHPDFNLVNCSVALQRFGLNYGSDTKDGKLYTWKPISECTFLKRSFRVEESYVFAPLDITSITKTLYYRRIGEDDGERYLKYYTRILELSQHPYEIFLKYGVWLLDLLRRDSTMLKLSPFLLKSDRSVYLTLQEKCLSLDFTIVSPL